MSNDEWSRKYKATESGGQVRITGTGWLEPGSEYRWMQLTDEILLLGHVREQDPPLLGSLEGEL